MTASSWESRPKPDDTTRPHDVRPAYERDRSRLIHSGAFRRLQAKTQVLGIEEGDFHRTRLTHTMEVAQIARGLVQQLHGSPKGTFSEEQLQALPTETLIEAVAFAHDLGHPPFGHGGEIALNYMMREHNGFEGNGQSLRLLARIESHTEGFGLNMTRRTLLGVLKYPRPYSEARRRELPPEVAHLSQVKAKDWKPPKCYLDDEIDTVEWILEPLSHEDRDRFIEWNTEPTSDESGKTRYKSFDCSLMELADDIAYGTHDLEDGVALGIIQPDDLIKALSNEFDKNWGAGVDLESPEALAEKLFDKNEGSGTRKRAAGSLVHALVSSVKIENLEGFESSMLAYRAVLSPPARQFLDNLQKLTLSRIVRTPQVQTLEYRGRQLVMRIFDALQTEPKSLLSGSFRSRYESAHDERNRMRTICDYVAGMTDSYATRMYERLFVPGQGNVFERL